MKKLLVSSFLFLIFLVAVIPAYGGYTVRIYNVDDSATLHINGSPIYEAQWGYHGTNPDWVYVGHQPGDSGEIDIDSDLVPGENTLRVTLYNEPLCCGAAISIEVKKNGKTIFTDDFSIQDSTSGIKYDRSGDIWNGLSQINLNSPMQSAYQTNAPTFTWTADGGVENRYVVDYAFSMSGPFFTSPVVQDESWTMPLSDWNVLPAPTSVFWRVRGGDLAESPLKIVSSDEIWSFFVPVFYEVIDESHILNDSDTVYLNNENIDLKTIVITDETGTITYTESVDYNLVQDAAKVEIERIPTGGILDGQTILVDYHYFVI